MKLFIRNIFVAELLKPHQPQQSNYFLLNLFLLPVNSDKSDENISLMKSPYMVLIKGAKFGYQFWRFQKQYLLIQNAINKIR